MLMCRLSSPSPPAQDFRSVFRPVKLRPNDGAAVERWVKTDLLLRQQARERGGGRERALGGGARRLFQPAATTHTVTIEACAFERHYDISHLSRA